MRDGGVLRGVAPQRRTEQQPAQPHGVDVRDVHSGLIRLHLCSAAEDARADIGAGQAKEEGGFDDQLWGAGEDGRKEPHQPCCPDRFLRRGRPERLQTCVLKLGAWGERVGSDQVPK